MAQEDFRAALWLVSGLAIMQVACGAGGGGCQNLKIKTYICFIMLGCLVSALIMTPADVPTSVMVAGRRCSFRPCVQAQLGASV
jgi:hypothetical protein